MGENVGENQPMKFNKKAKTISLLHLPAQERENFKFKNRCLVSQASVCAVHIPIFHSVLYNIAIVRLFKFHN
jgi:hypothetical protein